jgi:hypothetical protein
MTVTPKKIIIFFFFVALFFWLFNRYFLYTDKEYGCFIKIKPSILEFSSQNIKKGILVLKYADVDNYKELCNRIDVINPNISCGGFGGGCYRKTNFDNSEISRQIDISTPHNGFLGLTAAIIAHEVCHVRQAQENRSFSEKECYKLDDKVLQKVVEY